MLLSLFYRKTFIITENQFIMKFLLLILITLAIRSSTAANGVDVAVPVSI